MITGGTYELEEQHPIEQGLKQSKEWEKVSKQIDLKNNIQ